MVLSGLELVNLWETRKWNTQFHRKISNGKTGLPFQKFHFFRKFSSGTNRKIMFHLQPNRNFRNLLVNGKRPESLNCQDYSIEFHFFRTDYGEDVSVRTLNGQLEIFKVLMKDREFTCLDYILARIKQAL